MKTQMKKFIPEGWNKSEEKYNLEELQEAQMQGKIMQGLVRNCDKNYNLEIHLGKDIVGIIPRNEMDIIHQDSCGMTKTSICKNKVGQFVQFKVKEIYNKNRILLSRKEVRKGCFKLDKK